MGQIASDTRSSALVLSPPALGSSVIGGSLALNLLGLGMPVVTLQIFDRIIPNQATATLIVLFVGLCVVAAMEFVLRVARIHLIGHTGARFERDLSQRVFAHTLDAVPSAYEQDTTGTHFERLSAVGQLREHYSGQGRLLAIDLPFSAIFLAMIALIGGWLVVVPLTVLLLLSLGGLVGRSLQSTALARRKTVDGRRYSFLIEFLGEIATVKSGRMEPQMLRRYEMLNRQSISASRSLIRLSGLTQGFGAVIGQASVASLGLFGAYLVIENRIGVGELAACMMLNGRTTQPMLRLLGLLGQGESVAQARQRVAELAAVPLRPEPAALVEPLRGAVRLEKLCLRHPESGAVVFDRLNADLAPGDCVELRGRDGGGKSSLMRMILGEQAPHSGRVLIDGVAAHRRAAARGPGGIVMLDAAPVIFNGTIHDNLSLFGLVTDTARIRAVATATGLEDEIKSLPFGYQTGLSAGGGALPRGLLQCICVTRALCLDPRVLMLNNATSAIEGACLERTATALRAASASTTMLVVSTQPQIAGLASRVLDLAPTDLRAAITAWDGDRLGDRAAPVAAARSIA